MPPTAVVTYMDRKPVAFFRRTDGSLAPIYTETFAHAIEITHPDRFAGWDGGGTTYRDHYGRVRVS